MGKKQFLISSFIIFILIVFGFSFYYFQKIKKVKTYQEILQKENQNQEMESETYNLKFADEPVGFTVMSGSGMTPVFLSGGFSRRVPLVKPGEDFEVRIEVEDEKGVKNVIFVIQSEDQKKEKEYNLILKEGTPEKGIWKGVIRVTDEIPTIWYSYFKAKNKEGKQNTLQFNWK
ncbi:MAG: hypothetical protein ACP5H7_00740 [Minisyncoccia bacterium]